MVENVRLVIVVELVMIVRLVIIVRLVNICKIKEYLGVNWRTSHISEAV